MTVSVNDTSAAVWLQVRFSGMTPLGTGLDRKVIQPLVVSRARANQLQKPVLAIIITDGGQCACWHEWRIPCTKVVE